MKKLTKTHVFEFPVRRPFSFERTFHKPSHFKTNIETYNDDGYFVAMRYAGVSLGIRYSMARAVLLATVFSSEELGAGFLEELKSELSHRLSLALPLNEFYADCKSDKWTGGIVKRNYGKRIASIYSLYENLMISTFLQNATVQRTVSMCHNMLSAYGHPVAFGGMGLTALWGPGELNATEEQLKELKVGYRAKAIVRITEQFAKDQKFETRLRQLATLDLEKELLKIYGVGKQTVFYSILGQFHRTEYLRHIPLWERKILSRYIFKKELCDEQWMVEWFRERYGRWCGYALSLIFEDVFYQHKSERYPWLDRLLRKDDN